VDVNVDSLIPQQHAAGAESPDHPDAFLVDCRRYRESVLSIDDGVGRLLDAPDAPGTSGERDRTVMIFTSDNGLMLGEHGRRQKAVADEPSIQIPLAVRSSSWGRGSAR
jgi:arylsulfatase A-like enzyme